MNAPRQRDPLRAAPHQRSTALMRGPEGHCVFDMVGIGFGPSGIALAAAIEDGSGVNGGRSRLKVRFCERHSKNEWHLGFMLEGTDINHHFLRDLAMPRDPQSRFTFVNYLKRAGRLYEFGRLGRAPSRREWAAYIAWVADQLEEYVGRGEAVERVEPLFRGQSITGFEVTTSRNRLRARHIVVSTGAEPFIPDAFRPMLGARVFHTSEFLVRVGSLPPSVRQIVVVGAGQSAGEAIFDLRQRFPRANIVGIQRSSGFKLYDLGHFSNRVYSPEEAEYFYHLPERAKPDAFADTVRTNYSGLDQEISSALYSRMYEDRLAGSERISLLTRRKITRLIATAGSPVQINLADIYTGKGETLEADAVVLGTGYRSDAVPSLLSELRPYIAHNGSGTPLVGRDYRLHLDAPGPARVYLNGLCECSHGIADGQSFSMIALRAEAILESLVNANAATTAKADPPAQSGGAHVLGRSLATAAEEQP
jgi:L-ornithine N5-monooxygenase